MVCTVKGTAGLAYLATLSLLMDATCWKDAPSGAPIDSLRLSRRASRVIFPLPLLDETPSFWLWWLTPVLPRLPRGAGGSRGA